MIIELMLAACFGQQPPTPATPPADQVPPVSEPASTPTPPPAPSANIPALAPPPVADVAPRPRTPMPPRGARAAQAVPAAPSMPMTPGGVPHGQHAAPGGPPGRGGFGGDVYAPGHAMQGGRGQGMAMDVAAVYGMARRPVDPKEAELDRQAREAAGNMQREQDPAKKAQIKASLQALVAEQFQIRQQRRAAEMKRLEDEVMKLRDALDKREKSKDAIIARRIAELTGEDDLGF
jgi:hypothetical protein